jgi:hypothetical protein
MGHWAPFRVVMSSTTVIEVFTDKYNVRRLMEMV